MNLITIDIRIRESNLSIGNLLVMIIPSIYRFVFLIFHFGKSLGGGFQFLLNSLPHFPRNLERR